MYKYSALKVLRYGSKFGGNFFVTFWKRLPLGGVKRKENERSYEVNS